MNRDDLSLIFEKAAARAAQVFGYDLKPRLTHTAPSIDIFDLAVRDLIARVPDIFFLQIGAHDGLTFDPVHEYVRQHHWRGLLVEPQPAIFAQLQKNYAGESQLLFENSAVAPQDGTLDLHVFESADANDHASMLASTRKHYLQLNGDSARGTLKTITVPALSLASLLNKHKIDRVNLLQIDTEGLRLRNPPDGRFPPDQARDHPFRKQLPQSPPKERLARASSATRATRSSTSASTPSPTSSPGAKPSPPAPP